MTKILIGLLLIFAFVEADTLTMSELKKFSKEHKVLIVDKKDLSKHVKEKPKPLPLPKPMPKGEVKEKLLSEKMVVKSDTEKPEKKPKPIEVPPLTLEKLLQKSISGFEYIKKDKCKEQIMKFSSKYTELDFDMIKTMQITKENLEELLQVVREIR